MKSAPAIQHGNAEDIQAVILQIDRYRGETIVKGEHPLWLAIVALERVSRHSPRSVRQPHRLDYPASRHWFYCVWASRAGMLNVPPGMSRDEAAASGSLTYHANPQLALYWAGVLRATLLSFLERANEIGRQHERHP